MSYCTPDDVRILTMQVTGKDLSDAEIQKFIDQADALINAKLRVYYTIPFSPVPPLIQVISEQLAAAYCLRRLYTGHSRNQAPNQPLWHDDALMQLRSVLNEELDLVDSNGNLVPRRVLVSPDDPDRVMPEIVDPYPDYFSVAG